MPKIDILTLAQEEKGNPLTSNEEKNLNERVLFAKKWLEIYAPKDFVFKVLEETPKIELSPVQSRFISALRDRFAAKANWKGEELHTEIHNIKNELSIQPTDAFGAIYQIFLGKESGPQAGWMLASLEHQLVLDRLTDFSKQ